MVFCAVWLFWIFTDVAVVYVDDQDNDAAGVDCDDDDDGDDDDNDDDDDDDDDDDENDDDDNDDDDGYDDDGDFLCLLRSQLGVMVGSHQTH